MSHLIGAAQPRFHIEARDDRYAPHDPRRRGLLRTRSPARASPGYGHANPFWPSQARAFYGDYGVDTSGILGSGWSPRYYRRAQGAASRVGFVGVTRDQYGAPTGGCVVQLFLTATDAFIMEVTSDASGNFLLQSWYSPDAHYIVAYKAGSPDIFGTTVNTLVGA